jgi:hypothetical protein
LVIVSFFSLSQVFAQIHIANEFASAFVDQISNHPRRRSFSLKFTTTSNSRMNVSNATIEKPLQKASDKRTVRVPLARVLARNQCLALNSQQTMRERAEFLTRVKDIYDARQLALKNQTAK